MSKEIFFDKEARALMQKGCNMAADAIKSTLGYLGKTVVIAPGHGNFPIMTKDGVTVASSIVLDDPIMFTGALLIRNASESTVTDCGDGTTTSAVLAQSMINSGIDAVNNGANPQEVKAGIEKAVIKVIESLKKIAMPLANNENLKNVGIIASNNDVEIGTMLAEAYEKIGYEGLFSIEKTKTRESFVTIIGLPEMLSGWSSDAFVNNEEKMLVEYDNPLILVANYEIKTIAQIIPLMNSFNQKYNLQEQPLIIIAKDVTGRECGEFFNTFVVNRDYTNEEGVHIVSKTCLINAPNEYQREALVDIATLTGAKLITDDAGLKVENATLADLGTCKKIIISRRNTLIVDGGGNKEIIDNLKAKLITERDNAKEDAVKEVFEKRLARLSGSIGVIYVGGSSHVEQVERMHRVDDADRAIKSAIKEGFVAGGGIALIRCAKELEFDLTKGDEAIGTKIVMKACYEPLKTMLANAGISEELVMPFIINKSENQGYNLKTKEFADMIEANIIDPAKVVRCALQNAASVACQVINSGALLVEMSK